MRTVGEIEAFLNEKAPFEMQLSFDNAGFLVGDRGQQVERVLVALDITEETAAEAAELGAQLIVSHHPVIFHPIRRMTTEDVTARMVMALLHNGLSAICCHTNLDSVAGGVNDELARAAGLTNIAQLHQDGVDAQGRPYGIGRVGDLAAGESTLGDYLAFLKSALAPNGIRYADAGRPVRRVAVGGGACADMAADALAMGCDTFVTSDCKYDHFLNAAALGLNLIDAGHFPTENVICPVLVRWLGEGFPELEVIQSRRHHEAVSYF